MTALTPRTRPTQEAALRLQLHAREDYSRVRIEAFIRARFAAIHSAWIDDFLPTLISTQTTSQQIHAAAGFQWASENPLFLESYLDLPIEGRLRQLGQGSAQRSQIVEFGNLATGRPGAIRQLILVLANYFGRRGMDWAVLTLTPTLINSFSRLGLVLVPLAAARPERLQASTSYWGSYYDLNPQVVAINLPANQPRLQMLESLGVRRPTSTTPLLPMERINETSLFH
ncbi:thermostable hemolysin [Marinobacterium lutimaris]|uniref:Thermostable hemolysin n=1 Tax=Marinobacterium lutimaris TaxID=568106 RepID=A0A1H6AGS4_9GAMM|nr:thermostable hemolysin [Marinobacterium lutimaris]SEG47908.1 Thermostable hemolysin [Marinobacterium lutimaris]